MVEARATQYRAQVAAGNVLHHHGDAATDCDQVIGLHDGAVPQQSKHAGLVVHSSSDVIIAGDVVLEKFEGNCLGESGGSAHVCEVDFAKPADPQEAYQLKFSPIC